MRWDDAEARDAAKILGPGWPGAEAGIVLGSGMGAAAGSVDVRKEARFRDLPQLGDCAVPGHEGRLLRGVWEGTEVLVFQGRRHAYEGIPMARAAMPARIAAALGARVLVAVCAAGAVDPVLPVGSWVLVEDHLNLMGRNPLEGVVGPEGPAFVDLSRTYRTDLYGRVAERLAARGLASKRGVYAGFSGPTYETPAEVRMARILGSSVVGMSLVPEAVWACFLGLDVIAAARVANPAAGLASQTLDHADVVRHMERGAEETAVILEEILGVWRVSCSGPQPFAADR